MTGVCCYYRQADTAVTSHRVWSTGHRVPEAGQGHFSALCISSSPTLAAGCLQLWHVQRVSPMAGWWHSITQRSTEYWFIDWFSTKFCIHYSVSVCCSHLIKMLLVSILINVTWCWTHSVTSLSLVNLWRKAIQSKSFVLPSLYHKLRPLSTTACVFIS